jgi:hypothetical protein
VFRVVFSIVGAALCAACASAPAPGAAPEAGPEATPAAVAPASDPVEADVEREEPEAVRPLKAESMSPLQDFNLGRRKLPEVLLRAIEAPYAEPKVHGCSALGEEIVALDDALGPDLDRRTPDGGNQDLVARALLGAARGLVPYRGVVRVLTGANRRERLVAAAIAAGSVRRAYLKGLGEARGCALPARPAREPTEAAR